MQADGTSESKDSKAGADKKAKKDDGKDSSADSSSPKSDSKKNWYVKWRGSGLRRLWSGASFLY